MWTLALHKKFTDLIYLHERKQMYVILLSILHTYITNLNRECIFYAKCNLILSNRSFEDQIK